MEWEKKTSFTWHDLRASARVFVHGHLYAVQFEDDIIKVGRAMVPHARIQTHQRESKHGNIVDKYISVPCGNCYAAERMLIKRLSKYHAKSAGREWFKCDMDTAIDRIGYCINLHEPFTQDEYKRAFMAYEDTKSPKITIRVPATLKAKLKALAEHEERSISGQLTHIIEKQLPISFPQYV